MLDTLHNQLAPRLRALVVDDDPTFREMLRGMLEMLGLEVCAATDGVSAEAAFCEYSPQVVLCDLFMPERDGLEVLRALKRHDAHPSIIMTSGRAEGDWSWLQRASTQLGAKRFLKKPFGMSDLEGALCELLPRPLRSGVARVLVVEDDDGLRGLLSDILEQSGYEVIEARNGLDAMVTCRNLRPDVVLSDMMMPRLDGFDLLHDFAEVFPMIPVVAMSAAFVVNPGLVDSARARGAASILAKPFSPDDVVAAVNRALEEQKRLP